MKLIQISDMHIKKDTDIDSQMIIIDKMVESLKDDIVDKEDIVFCVLGDIIEKGDEKAFPNAKKIIKKIRTSFKSKFPKSRLYFEFVPGNHDRVGCDNLDEDNKKKKLSRPLTVKKVCAFDKFDEFINDIQKSDCKYSSKNYFTSKYDNIDLLLLNSAIENCKNGKIDLNAFKRKFEKPTIILAHHALMSMYDSDGSAIRNGITVLEKIRENNVIAMLHGHAHGFVYTDFGLTCKCIGVGPFLKVDNLPDVYRQFNFFNIQGSSILEVKNFIYRSDGGGKFFPYDKSLHPHQNNNFSGSSIKEIYDHVVTATNDMRIIRNLRIHLNCEYDVFKKDIKKHFKKDIKKAEDWQASELKPEWYFNHGERMRYGEKDGLDYVINELKKKPNTGRAIIPLMNFSDVIEQSNIDKFPSLISYQFALNREPKLELIVTVYLRSLEVANFLKINLCEVYNICERINICIKGIQTIDLNIFAFKAEHFPNFGCFRKATLDVMAETKKTEFLLYEFIRQKKVKKIVEMLEEKKKLGETVIVSSGISVLNDSLISLKEQGLNPYTPKVLNSTKKLLSAMEHLKTDRKSHSMGEVKELEKNVIKCIDALIADFKKNEKIL